MSPSSPYRWFCMKYSKKYRKNQDKYWNSFLYMHQSMWNYSLPYNSPCILRNKNPYSLRYNQSKYDRHHHRYCHHCHRHCQD